MATTSRLRRLRVILWAIVGAAAAAVLVIGLAYPPNPIASKGAKIGGDFRLVGADGKPFSSAALAGKPYAIFFGFTRCGDVCPTTLSRLVRLRREVGNDEAFQVVFVTIDPQNDGPREVGQYAHLFNAPIIGLTGTSEQIAKVKKQFGIYAEPDPHGGMGKQFAHTGSVLLFDRSGQLAGTLSPTEADNDAIAKLRKLID